MTLLVGLKYKYTSILISDTRVSYEHRSDVMDFSLKSGFLFPGCVYAATGDMSEIRKFIIKVKSDLTSKTWKTYKFYWEKFNTITGKYHFSINSKKNFKLLLASRAQRESILYVLDSSTGLINTCGDFVILGSGGKFAGDIRDYWNNTKSVYEEEFRGYPSYIMGYAICQVLTILGQGEYNKIFNKYHVGGVFHFSYQDSRGEYRQGPAVYDVIHISRQDKIIVHILFRVTFEKMAMIVEYGPKKSFNISVDSAAWPKIFKLNKTEKDALISKLKIGSINQKFYEYLGVGFADEKYSDKWLYHISGNDEFLITRNSISSEIDNFVKDVISEK